MATFCGFIMSGLWEKEMTFLLDVPVSLSGLLSVQAIPPYSRPGSISQTRPGPSSFWGSREEQRVSVHEKETRQDMFPKPEQCHTQPSKRPGLRMDISAQKETGLMVVVAGHHGLTSSGVTGSGEPCRISSQSPLNMNIIGEWYMLFPWGLACRHAVSSN